MSLFFTHIKSNYADPCPILSQSHPLLFAAADLGKGTPLFLNQTEAKGPRGRDTVLYAKYMLECGPCHLKVWIRH